MIRLPTLVLLGSLAVGLASGRVPKRDYEVLGVYPHDSAAYTQGLLWDNGSLLESTGRYGKSEVRRVDLVSGKVVRAVRLPDNRFGEGLARIGNRLVVLTWESRVAYVLNPRTLGVVDSLTYWGEGWGLTSDDRVFYLSDGSDSIRVISPFNFRVERTIHVRISGEPLKLLNELEYVDGQLLANIYETNKIARIDVATGNATLIDLGALYPQGERPQKSDVMNGISRGPVPGTVLLTGKLWPKLFMVRLLPKA